jgi:general stress protein YciG
MTRPGAVRRGGAAPRACACGGPPPRVAVRGRTATAAAADDPAKVQEGGREGGEAHLPRGEPSSGRILLRSGGVKGVSSPLLHTSGGGFPGIEDPLKFLELP